MRHFRPLLLALTAATALASTLAIGGADAPRPLKFEAFDRKVAAGTEMVNGLIVRPHRRRGGKLAHALRSRDARALNRVARAELRVHRQMSDDAHVLRLEQPVTLEEAKNISARLMREGDIELAEPDRVLRPFVNPSDPGYSFQWHYWTPAGSNKGGANLPNAWNLTTGSATVKVAVLDTGYLAHTDLPNLLPGHDFVSNTTVSNDGNGRDADATDPGDDCSTAASTVSSWHGTHVAGTIVARMNNAGPPGLHGAGIAPGVGLVPVRVLGRCGGMTSDIVDAMRWAAGIGVPGAPAHAKPAQVVNLSLGGPGSCSAAFRSAVQDVASQGAVVVVAAGNDASTALSEPANCAGVIAVTAHAIDGDNANYANIGKEVALSAPGGGCGTLTTTATCTARLSANGLGIYSTSNIGAASPVGSPGGDTYKVGSGTSMAAPHVSGVVALMLSRNAALTPAQIKSYLQSSARAHAAGTTCTQNRYLGLCGAGMLDAEAALQQVDDLPPAVVLENSYQVVAPGANVTLTGSAAPAAGRTATYSWTQVGSVAVGLSPTSVNGNTASASFSAPATGVYTFRLTAQDNTSKVGTATATVRVNSAPSVASVAAQSVNVGSPLNFKINVSDPDGDTVFVTVDGLPSGAGYGGGTFVWGNASPVGTYTVTFTATDTNGAVSTSNVTINVAAPPGGGGGSMDPWLLAACGLLLCVVKRRARRAVA
jgi:serine protease